MADENETLEEGVEGEVAPEENVDQQDEVQDEPDPYAPLAEKIGWVPKDQFKGNPDDWKPAEQYILDGKDIQKATARELREMRSTVETMAKTSAALFAERLHEEKEKLAAQYAQAVDDGDPDKAWKISQKINGLNGQAQHFVQPPGPPAEAQDWVAKNQWFLNDPIAQTIALNTAEIYARSGKSTAEQLQAAEREVRRQRPDLFQQGKAAPGVSSPGGRVATASNRAKGFADMPKAAQDVARDMVDRGVIKNLDDYTRNYWATEGKAR